MLLCFKEAKLFLVSLGLTPGVKNELVTLPQPAFFFFFYFKVLLLLFCKRFTELKVI